MKVTPTAIPDVLVVEPRIYADARGWFAETWHAGKFDAAGLDLRFVQDNHSRSVRGVLRGLHFQLARPQGKLVRVVHGEVFDVAVDLRRSSPTFGRWVGEHLSADNHRMLWVPPGFAHGFLALSATADFVYKCTDYYDPASERTLLWDDADVGIVWPLAHGERPALSEKDAAGAPLHTVECYG